MLHMSQFLLQQRKFPRFFSTSDFSFNRASLSGGDFVLRNLTRGGFGCTYFHKDDFST